MEIAVKNVLIPIGPYTDAEALLRILDIVDGISDAEITLLGVVTIPVVTSINEDEIRDLKKYEDIDKHLYSVQRLFNDVGLEKVNRKIVVSRDVAEAIIEEASTNIYDLLILVKRRKAPLVVRRSISRAVIPKVFIPVLVLTMD